MDAIEMLEARHAELEDLFHELSGARDADTKRLIFEDIAATLAVHRALVARGPWLLAQISLTRPSVDRLVAELRHESVHGSVHESVKDQTFDAKLLTLQEEVEREMDELETALTPSLGASRGARTFASEAAA